MQRSGDGPCTLLMCCRLSFVHSWQRRWNTALDIGKASAGVLFYVVRAVLWCTHSASHTFISSPPCCEVDVRHPSCLVWAAFEKNPFQCLFRNIQCTLLHSYYTVILIACYICQAQTHTLDLLSHLFSSQGQVCTLKTRFVYAGVDVDTHYHVASMFPRPPCEDLWIHLFMILCVCVRGRVRGTSVPPVVPPALGLSSACPAASWGSLSQCNSLVNKELQ